MYQPLYETREKTMTTITFYPIGNADCTLIHLSDDQIILKDYACFETSDDNDKRVVLSDELQSYLKFNKRDSLDIVAFSHADDDHVHGAESFFWFEHSDKYQGEDRVKIKELHVPSNFILETNLKGSAKIIRQEARYRLKKGSGIRVYGEPDSLSSWLEEAEIELEERAHLITRAGSLVPGFSQDDNMVEIFVHSPFTFRVEEDDTVRNDNSLVWHITFFEDNLVYRCILGADAEFQAWKDIVNLTINHGNDDRLKFDLFRISHHCSYSALSEEKGDAETIPCDEVKDLFKRGEDGCILISSSNTIPEEDTDQPPHYQAANFYKKVAKEKGMQSNFYVTMEFPSEEDPEPIVVETTSYGLKVIKSSGLSGVSSVIRKQPPRVGK